MKTFNGKPWYRNVIAVLLGFAGIHFLGKAWIYHLLVQLVTMPKAEWLNPLNRDTWVIREGYPSGFCKWFCNIEATMMNQLNLLRDGFAEEYCFEELTYSSTTRVSINQKGYFNNDKFNQQN